MREIKFRAFVTSEETLCRVISFNFENETIVVDFDRKYTGQYRFEYVELMQYTGLKDKNGVEIYEGDLVEHEDDIDGRWELYEACEIIYSTEVHGFCFRMDEGNSLSDYRNFEVVGNRYENPELMEG